MMVKILELHSTIRKNSMNEDQTLQAEEVPGMVVVDVDAPEDEAMVVVEAITTMTVEVPAACNSRERKKKDRMPVGRMHNIF
jgi:hypothetical protein